MANSLSTAHVSYKESETRYPEYFLLAAGANHLKLSLSRQIQWSDELAAHVGQSHPRCAGAGPIAPLESSNDYRNAGPNKGARPSTATSTRSRSSTDLRSAAS